MVRIAIVDHGLCNLDSIARALEHCGGDVALHDEPDGLERAHRIVLPGVGSFRDAMEELTRRDLVAALRSRADAGVPILGICLGMQLLATSGSEEGTTRGLDLIAGDVVKLVPGNGERIPHIGWNEVNPVTDAALFRNIDVGTDFYFVHSYRFAPGEGTDVLATTPYAGGFVSAIRRRNITGVQFHPEKSQSAGFQLLRNFVGSA